MNDFIAKISLMNCGVFGLATWIDPQWATVVIAFGSAIFPAHYYYHKTKKTRLENKLLEKQLQRESLEEDERA